MTKNSTVLLNGLSLISLKVEISRTEAMRTLGKHVIEESSNVKTSKNMIYIINHYYCDCAVFITSSNYSWRIKHPC